MSTDPKTSAEAEHFGWWVCACVKRDRTGRLTHLKMNAPTVTVCRKCRCTKEQHDEIARRSGER